MKPGAVRSFAAHVLLLVLALGLAGCGTPGMSGDEAAGVALGAFGAAGVEPTVTGVEPDATVDRAGDGATIRVHLVDLELDGRAYRAGVHPSKGAVVRLFEPADTALTDDAVAAIAAHRANPAADDARPGRIAAWIVVLVAAATGAYLYLRSRRLQAERAGDGEEIPL